MHLILWWIYNRNSNCYFVWARIECEQQVLGYPSAKFRKFETIREAEAYLTPISRSRTVAGSRSSAPVNASSNKRTRWSSPSATTTRFPALNCLTGTAPVLQFVATMSTSSRNEAGVASGIPIDTGTAVRQVSYIYLWLRRDNSWVYWIERPHAIFIRTSHHQRPATAVADPITAKNGCYNTDSDGFVHVYTHGICSAKGCRNAKAGIGVYFGDNHPLWVANSRLHQKNTFIFDFNLFAVCFFFQKPSGSARWTANGQLCTNSCSNQSHPIG